jgi:predicted metal-binding membrane protein
VISFLAGLMALAWGYMIMEARSMNLTGACCCAGMKLSGPDTGCWNVATLFPIFLMWTEMMIAMMIPSAAPMILLFAQVNRTRQEREQPFVSTAIFTAGYLAVWTAFSALAALASNGRL